MNLILSKKIENTIAKIDFTFIEYNADLILQYCNKLDKDQSLYLIQDLLELYCEATKKSLNVYYAEYKNEGLVFILLENEDKILDKIADWKYTFGCNRCNDYGCGNCFNND